MDSLLEKLTEISVSNWAQVIASIATALTAFFSWKAIQQAEEMNIKPVLATTGARYFGKVFSVNVSNLSQAGDKWARDIKLSILGTQLKTVVPRSYGTWERQAIRF